MRPVNLIKKPIQRLNLSRLSKQSKRLRLSKHILWVGLIGLHCSTAIADTNQSIDPQTSWFATVTDSLSTTWSNLWQTNSQQAQQAFNQGNFSRAAELFSQASDNTLNQQWQASSQYKQGEYAQSAQLFRAQQQNYNLGNALAKSGDLQGAVEAYDKHLKNYPNDEDAKFNRDLVKKLQEQQDKNNQNNQDNQNKDDKQNQDKQDKQQNDQNSQNQDKTDNQDKDNQEQDNQEQDDKNQDNQEKDKQDNKESQDKESQDKDSQENKADTDKDKKDDKEDKNKQDKASKPNQAQPAEPLDQATEQTLRRVPDDSSGLLRARIMQYYRTKQYIERQSQRKIFD